MASNPGGESVSSNNTETHGLISELCFPVAPVQRIPGVRPYLTPFARGSCECPSTTPCCCPDSRFEQSRTVGQLKVPSSYMRLHVDPGRSTRTGQDRCSGSIWEHPHINSTQLPQSQGLGEISSLLFHSTRSFFSF